MIEATCAACGTVARIAESDVPVGAKFVTCASCKARVVLPQQAASSTPAKGIKSVSIPAIPKTPPPIPAKGRSDTIDLADLPAPKRSSPLAGAEPSKPAPRSALSGADLPAPKVAKPPAPAPGALDLDDLMPADLPAPKGKSDIGLADLPAPKPKASSLGDLPAGKGKQASALTDLPAPKSKASALTDLPAPKAKSEALADLPTPKRSGLPPGKIPDVDDGLDLPMPKPGANNDLPAPKGFFDDLPQPAKPSTGGAPTIDLPAPKGFFDDLPQPAKASAQTRGPGQEVAPKGFFDDLPQPAKGGGASTDVTPKGGGSQSVTPKGAGSQAVTPKGPGQEVAPKGFFDDLPQPAKGGGKAGLFDDLPQPTKPAAGGLFDDLPQPSTSQDIPLELGNGAGPDLDLGLPLGESGGFQDLDLGEPLKRGGAAPPDEPASPIKIKTPAKGAAPAKPIPIVVPKDPKQGGELKLDLADDPHGGVGAPAATSAKKAAAGKKKGPTPEEAAEVRAAKRRRSRIILGAVLGLAALGAGGFYVYQRQMKQKERREKIETGITGARAALKAEAPTHWANALGQAQQVIDMDPNNTVALGLASEASFAGALDSGVNGPARIAQGRKFMTDGLGAGKVSKELDRAQALSYVAANQFDKAIPRLQGLIQQDPTDGWLQLYLGWAELGAGDADAALKAFDQAVAKTKQTKIPALYGHGRAKLLLADIAAARTDFETILQTSKDHVCAQVQLAATLEPSKAAQRDADLKGILERKDVKAKQADPRCITQVYVNLGDVAASNGRLDIARDNYRKAIGATANDVDALVGLARVEIRDNKLPVAADHVQKALAANANAPHAQLANAELLVAQGKLPDAQKQIDALAARKPPLVKLDQATLQVVKGKLLVALGKPEEAIEAYAEGAKLAGELDLTPTMAAVTLLTDLAKKDETKAADYRKRADEMLSAFATRAQDDPQLSAQLGVAYLQAGDATKAETFLRRAVTMRDEDPEPKISLAIALSQLGRTDEALEQIQSAIKLDGKRVDFQLQLALTFQNAGRDAQAIEAYDKLLAMPDAPIIVRANAGKYFAKKGLLDRNLDLIKKGAVQSEPILKAEPENAAGLYLKGEGLIQTGKFDEATPVLTKASDIDPDAQYLDALGRAYEGRIESDKKFIEAARNAYDRASKADPKLVHAMVGQGAMLVRQTHYDQALKPLLAAIALDRTNSEIQFWIGEAYYGLRNVDKDYAKTGAQWLDTAVHKGVPELPIERRAEAAHDLGTLYDEKLNNAAGCAAAWELAQSLGEQIIKDKGEAPALEKMRWFVEGYYYLGDTYAKMNNPVAQKKAWLKYLERGKDTTHVKVVNQQLATNLQRY
ncbi:MAG TPA: tetratricopeptide repeat protein [Kofleriaceae bacterium]|nr:tetratricopeptide repeat protein [Kofleriaceae bacterium]